nr:MAG TPA: hypothetical protein [Caudoviricetes sp.]
MRSTDFTYSGSVAVDFSLDVRYIFCALFCFWSVFSLCDIVI